MNTIQLQPSIILLIAGFTLSICGLLYPNRAFQNQDHQVFMFLHLKLKKQVPFFRRLWPLGKTPFTIVILGVLFFYDLSSGFTATLFFGIIACLERLLKLTVKRPRPFSVLTDVQMSQPKKPEDPSHPSGDAMRIWYLAFVVPLTFGLPVSAVFIFCCIAVLVSLGRIGLGVHFPLDVIGGTGLGFFGAGLYRLFF